MALARTFSESILGGASLQDTDGLANSIGGTYAFFLSRSPRVALSVIARSNYDAVQKKVDLGVHVVAEQDAAKLGFLGNDDAFHDVWSPFVPS